MRQLNPGILALHRLNYVEPKTELGGCIMPQYVISYLGGDQPASTEEGSRNFSRYMDWLNGLGDSAVSPANPLKNTKTVNPDGSVTDSGRTMMSGFTIIEAESMEAALSVARRCPFLEINGSLEVSEIIQMPDKK
jgi:hypothetical protein